MFLSQIRIHFYSVFTNNDNKPKQMKINPTQSHRAIANDSRYGPTFGCGSDIHISLRKTGCYPNLCSSYPQSQYAYESNEAQTATHCSREFSFSHTMKLFFVMLSLKCFFSRIKRKIEGKHCININLYLKLILFLTFKIFNVHFRI